MALVEVFEGDADAPVAAREFAFLPRVGEYLSRQDDGFFRYWNVVEVWHRETAAGFQSCIRVELDD